MAAGEVSHSEKRVCSSTEAAGAPLPVQRGRDPAQLELWVPWALAPRGHRANPLLRPRRLRMGKGPALTGKAGLSHIEQMPLCFLYVC